MKQKTWEECLYEVTKNYFASWKNNLREDEQTFNNIIDSDKIILLKEAIELYNQETAAERDEINRLREEMDALQKELADTQINLSTVEEENERLKKLLLKLKDDYNSFIKVLTM